MNSYFHHEKLSIYRKSIEFVARAEEIVQTISTRAAVKDQIERAAESIPFHVAASNANQSASEQRRLIDIAIGSVAECAACLDVMNAKQLVDSSRVDEEKRQLLEMFKMLFGLRRSREDRLKEAASDYGREMFQHERLEAYQAAISLVQWIDTFTSGRDLKTRTLDVLDRSSTAIVLNIAEGNAKFSGLDRAKFLDAAVSGGLRVSAALDVILARRVAACSEIEPAKKLLVRAVSLVIGLRRQAVSPPSSDS